MTKIMTLGSPETLCYNTRILLIALFVILPSATPAIGYVIEHDTYVPALLVRSGSTDPFNDPPHGLPRPYAQLIILGVIVILVVLLIWCWSRRPFSSRWITHRSRTGPSLSCRNPRLLSLSSQTTSTRRSTEMRATSGLQDPVSFDSKKVNKLGEDGNARMPIYVRLPGIPPPAITRSAQ